MSGHRGKNKDLRASSPGKNMCSLPDPLYQRQAISKRGSYCFWSCWNFGIAPVVTAVAFVGLLPVNQ